MPAAVATLRRALLRGLVIPAHPLALTEARRLDERRQVALTRYYCDAGAGGIAVGVHTTQFAIRDPAVGLLQPVLDAGDADGAGLVRRSRAAARHDRRRLRTDGAGARAKRSWRRRSATTPRCSACGALRDADNRDVLDHCRRVADVIPIVGFYLQPAVGGRVLDRAFWRGFLEIDRVVAIKVAPFDRYRTLDVVTRARRERPRPTSRSTRGTTMRSWPIC